jgi:hypothetical protein
MNLFKKKIGKKDINNQEIKEGDKIEYKYDFFGHGDYQIKTTIVRYSEEKSGFLPFVNWKSIVDGYDVKVIK